MDEIVKKALDKVNIARRIFGLSPLDDLPKGRPEDDELCPIAQAFKDFPGEYVSVEKDEISWRFRDYDERLELLTDIWNTFLAEDKNNLDLTMNKYIIGSPEEIEEFVVKFDAGELPEYIIQEIDTNENS